MAQSLNRRRFLSTASAAIMFAESARGTDRGQKVMAHETSILLTTFFVLAFAPAFAAAAQPVNPALSPEARELLIPRERLAKWKQGEPSQASHSTGPIRTEIRKEDGCFRLYRGGQPYHVNGVVYTGDRGGRFPLKDVAAHGANSIRSSGGIGALEEAHRLGLSVLVNLGMRMEKVHKFDYSDEKAVRKQFDRIKERIRQLKDHPVVLMWAIGNELTVFEATNKRV
jgi:hypothetical protein